MYNPFQEVMYKLEEKTGKYKVSYRQKQNGPYNQTWFDNEPAAKKFLADVEKKGGAGSIQTESVNEALGTNYKRTGDKDDKRVEKNLSKHSDLMAKFIKDGMDKDAASKKAYRIVTGLEKNESVNEATSYTVLQLKGKLKDGNTKFELNGKKVDNTTIRQHLSRLSNLKQISVKTRVDDKERDIYNLLENEYINEDFKVGDTIDFHDDLKRMVGGKIVKITGDIVTIDRAGIKFKRKKSEIFS